MRRAFILLSAVIATAMVYACVGDDAVTGGPTPDPGVEGGSGADSASGTDAAEAKDTSSPIVDGALPDGADAAGFDAGPPAWTSAISDAGAVSMGAAAGDLLCTFQF